MTPEGRGPSLSMHSPLPEENLGRRNILSWGLGGVRKSWVGGLPARSMLPYKRPENLDSRGFSGGDYIFFFCLMATFNQMDCI